MAGRVWGGHVGDGVADDVNNVGQGKHRQTEALAGAQVEHAQQAHCFDQVAADQQNAQLAETGVDAVVDECQHRVGEAVQNAGQHQDDAHGCGGDAVADAGRITCHTDQGIDAHAHKGVAGIADDLPEFRAAVLYAVHFTGAGFLLEHNDFSSFLCETGSAFPDTRITECNRHSRTKSWNLGCKFVQ